MTLDSAVSLRYKPRLNGNYFYMGIKLRIGYLDPI